MVRGGSHEQAVYPGVGRRRAQTTEEYSAHFADGFNISEVSFHRWKRQFGQMELSEARRLKELERENSELKKMLAESLLKNRVLEAVAEKMVSPAHRRQAAAPSSNVGCVAGGQRAISCGWPEPPSVTVVSRSARGRGGWL